MATNSPNPDKMLEELSKGVSPIDKSGVENQMPFPLPQGVHLQVGIKQIVQQSLPSPEILTQYAEINPAIVDSLIANYDAPRLRAEEEQKHRHELENSLSRRNFLAFVLSNLMGGFLTLFSIGGAIYCAKMGQTKVACLLACTTIATILAAFVGTRKPKQKTSSKEDKPSN